MRNKEGGQKFGNRQVVRPLSRGIFDQYVINLVRSELRDFDAYVAKYPNQFVSMISKDRGITWSISRMGDQIEVRPAPQTTDWVKRVDEFTSDIAISQGNTADSDHEDASRAQSGGQFGVNGYFYKGGQFLPSTTVEPGKWKIGKKWVRSGRELVSPGYSENQPTPFSRSIFSMISVWCLLDPANGKLAIRENIRDHKGIAITKDDMFRPGVKGVLGAESLSLGEFIDAYNNGQRWFDVKPEEKSIITDQQTESNPASPAP